MLGMFVFEFPIQIPSLLLGVALGMIVTNVWGRRKPREQFCDVHC